MLRSLLLLTTRRVDDPAKQASSTAKKGANGANGANGGECQGLGRRWMGAGRYAGICRNTQEYAGNTQAKVGQRRQEGGEILAHDNDRWLKKKSVSARLKFLQQLPVQLPHRRTAPHHRTTPVIGRHHTWTRLCHAAATPPLPGRLARSSIICVHPGGQQYRSRRR